MATGFHYTTSEDVGSVLIAHAAGSLIAALDFALTTGPSPWTKTVNGTNDATYQAPGGSQIKVRVYDNVSSSTSIVRRITAQVGSGLVFPTATQEANASLGYVVYRVRTNTSSASTSDARWFCVRTDRYFLFSSVKHGTSDVAYMMAAGDMPTILDGDPGLCALLAHTSSTFTSTANTGTNFSGIFGQFDAVSASVTEVGYAEFRQDGVTTPVPAGVFGLGPCGYVGRYTDTLGQIYLAPVMVVTADTPISVNPFHAIRGTVPFLRTIANDLTGLANEDTFTQGGATYRVVLGGNNNDAAAAVMISDHESGLP